MGTLRVGVALAAATIAFLFSGCAALGAATEAAAPVLLADVERFLVEEMRRATDPQRARDLAEAQRTLDDCRAAQVAAEHAARRATAVAVVTDGEVERAAREREWAERIRVETLRTRLEAQLGRLGIRGVIRPLSKGANEDADAGAGGVP